MDARDKTELDRSTELAHEGAVQAAAALEQMVDRAIRADLPVVVEGSDRGEAPNGPGEPSDWRTGVFFDFEGCFEAIVGILFPVSETRTLVRRVVGSETVELGPELIESVLMEVGNILASHVASAIADALAGRLLPSVPTLALDDAEPKLHAWIEARVGGGALRIESRLHDESGTIRGRLVLVPTCLAESSQPTGASEKPV